MSVSLLYLCLSVWTGVSVCDRVQMTRIAPYRRFALGVDPGKATRVVLWCTAMSGVMIYPIPSMSQCECDCLWDASQCVSYALLSSTHYKT